MALLDDFTKKAAQFTEKTIDKSKEIAGVAELKVKRKSLEASLDEQYQLLGQQYYEMIVNDDNVDEKVMQMRTDIAEIRDKIAKIDVEINKVKNT
jgi:ABC-type enterochelin transport system substrate-binding protein